MSDFERFPKIPRLYRDIVITEKIDGSNAQVVVLDNGGVLAGSRSRWITTGKGNDNFGFAAWVEEHKDELRQLGPGRHFGEWWGQGIQRGYGLDHKRFSLFNTHRWLDDRGNKHPSVPDCCDVVPLLYFGNFTTEVVNAWVHRLGSLGSHAAPGFDKPEGVVVFHIASSTTFKVTCEGDEKPKGS